MFLSKVPRVFVLAGLVLAFLVFSTSRYLYEDVGAYYPPKPPPQHQQPPPPPPPPSALEPLPGSAPPKKPDAPVPVPPGSVTGGTADAVGSELEPPGPGAVQSSPAPDGLPAIGTGSITSPGSTGSSGSKGADSSASTGSSGSTGSSASWGSAGDIPRPPGQCIAELDFLKESQKVLNLTSRVMYSRRCIQPVVSATVDRDALSVIDEPLVGRQAAVDIEHCQHIKMPKCVPVKLTVPEPYPKDEKFPHIMFGIATDFNRLIDAMDGFAHWLPNTDARLVAIVTDIKAHAASEIEKLQHDIRSLGIEALLVKPIDDGHTTTQSHFTVITHMINNAGPKTQWFALLDDDTFFPSLHPLSEALARIDHTKDAYVGALSEDFNQVRIFGFMAYGGAGAYLSAPLAKKLAANAGSCVTLAPEGDAIVRDCVYRHSKAKLTLLPGLYQQDTRGDVSGFFESGPRAINFHHWKTWYAEPLVQMATTAQYCGDCFLQRWAWDGQELLANGYSITRYRGGLKNVNLDVVEGSWDNPTPEYDFSIGPLRPKLSPDDKKTWKLEEANLTRGGGGDVFKQLYVHRGDRQAGQLDEVVELVWGDHDGAGGRL